MPRKGKKGGRKSKSKAKSKSKPRSRPKPKSKTRSKRKGLLGVITSDVAIKMVKEAVAADEIFHLKQRVVFLRAEREQLKRRVTKREEQQEAVFDTLKQRVFDGQAEIQALVEKTKENDGRRRREHDYTHRILEERLQEVESQRMKMAFMEKDLQEKNKTLGKLAEDARCAVIRNDEFAEGTKRLEQAEHRLDVFQRKFFVVGKAGAGEQMRQAVVDNLGRQAGKISCLGIGIRDTLRPPREVLGVGLAPLLVEGMSQFPDDVRLARDTLALLGHVASMETLRGTFLTTNKLYLNVVAALQRHVTDGMVALHAARLLHKTSHQGEATARDLRITGVIPLLAEALATAAYGPNGARRPRRLLYHGFQAIRLCYQRGFFGESLLALKLQASTHKPQFSLNTISNALKRRNYAYPAVEAKKTLDITQINNLRSSPSAFKKAAAVRARARIMHSACASQRPPFQRLPALKEPSSGGIFHGEICNSPEIRPKARLRQAKAECELETDDGNAYWDLLGGMGDARVKTAEHKEVTSSATASAVLLRWAMEGMKVKNGDDEVSEYPVLAPKASETGKLTDAPSRNVPRQKQSKRESRRSFRGKANPTVSDPASRHFPESKDDNFFSDTLDDAKQSENGSGNAGIIPNTRPSLLPLSCNLERPRAPSRTLLKPAAAGDKPKWLEKARCVRDSVCSSNEVETAINGTGALNSGGRNRATSGLGTSLCKSFPNRWQESAAHEVALHALLCLLRAAEIDVYSCIKAAGNGCTATVVKDSVLWPEGRAVVMEEGVLLLILRACEMFRDQDQVVTACLMLMRVGVRCSTETTYRGRSQPVVPVVSRAALLINNDVQGVVKRVVKGHHDKHPVTTEASALLKTLGLDPLEVKGPNVPPVLPPPPPYVEDNLQRSDTIEPTTGATIVTVEAVTRTSPLNLDLEHQRPTK